ncbi:hypothetical protein SBOR_2481 [Sclerotinia borealis F-4128]|uniref:Uncharacterized protein n=1 Tax=Sclerotinia borealis (strain F-4128) TaxID=1432307 RepID=W9CM60_SCLBF|nr:hypothetical protein SBOR_2481 [Sclerotinia borealis F-4128]
MVRKRARRGKPVLQPSTNRMRLPDPPMAMPTSSFAAEPNDAAFLPLKDIKLEDIKLEDIKPKDIKPEDIKFEYRLSNRITAIFSVSIDYPPYNDDGPWTDFSHTRWQPIWHCCIQIETRQLTTPSLSKRLFDAIVSAKPHLATPFEFQRLDIRLTRATSHMGIQAKLIDSWRFNKDWQDLNRNQILHHNVPLTTVQKQLPLLSKSSLAHLVSWKFEIKEPHFRKLLPVFGLLSSLNMRLAKIEITLLREHIHECLAFKEKDLQESANLTNSDASAAQLQLQNTSDYVTTANDGVYPILWREECRPYLERGRIVVWLQNVCNMDRMESGIELH